MNVTEQPVLARNLTHVHSKDEMRDKSKMMKIEEICLLSCYALWLF
jgi:hypothetical protein